MKNNYPNATDKLLDFKGGEVSSLLSVAGKLLWCRLPPSLGKLGCHSRLWAGRRIEISPLA